MNVRKVFSFFNGVPGIIAALLAAAGAFQLYVHAREKAAIERSRWEQQVDSLKAAAVRDSTEAAARDSARVDTIQQYQAEALHAKRAASQAAASARTASVALHQLLDSNGTALALLDSLESAHAAQVSSLYQALAFADSVHRVDSARVADRDGQIAVLRQSLFNMTERATVAEKASHPGAITTILRSPLTHLAFAAGGYLLGKKS